VPNLSAGPGVDVSLVCGHPFGRSGLVLPSRMGRLLGPNLTDDSSPIIVSVAVPVWDSGTGTEYGVRSAALVRSTGTDTRRSTTPPVCVAESCQASHKGEYYYMHCEDKVCLTVDCMTIMHVLYTSRRVLALALRTLRKYYPTRTSEYKCLLIEVVRSTA
jgi:hypothetical protein